MCIVEIVALSLSVHRIVKTLTQILKSGAFVKGSWEGVTRNVVDGFLSAKDFLGQTKIFMGGIERDTREARQNDCNLCLTKGTN